LGYPVIGTPQSQDDLKSIVRYIREDSPQRARAFGNTLIEQDLSIGSFPEMERVVPELDDRNVREITHRSYRIIYEVVSDPEAIYILRFWHGARGIPELPHG
jgi:plasmid stabilization system protein ParE